MSALQYANNAKTTLAAAIIDTDLSITLAGGDGALFPSSGPFIVTLTKASGTREIVLIDSRSSDVLTVNASGRGYESTTALSYSAGDVTSGVEVALRITKASLDGFLQKAGGTMTGVLQVLDGSQAAPGLRFSSSTTGLFSQTDNTVRVSCNNNEIAQFNLTNFGLTCGQIAFPASQSASSNANTLDDYEEGTFTPGVSFGGGTTGITYTTQTGTYTKIGNRVLVDGIVTLSNKGSSTGSALVTGLPFTVAAATFSVPGLRITALAAALDAYPTMLFTAGAATANLQMLNNGSSTIANLDDTNFGNTTQIVFGGQFRV